MEFTLYLERNGDNMTMLLQCYYNVTKIRGEVLNIIDYCFCIESNVSIV